MQITDRLPVRSCCVRCTGVQSADMVDVRTES